MNLPRLKLPHPTDVSSYLRLGALLLIAGLGLALFVFLYRDFYQTIVQTETIRVLEEEVALEDVNLQLFQKVKAIDEAKRQSILPTLIPNPFARETRINTEINTDTKNQ